MSLTNGSETTLTLELQPMQKQENNSSTVTIPTREIPYLPPEMIEHIVSFILSDTPEHDDDYNNNIYVKIHNYEYTLLNLFIVFPHLLRQIAPKLDYGSIPIYIYNFIYMKIDNVYDTLVMLFENVKAARHDLDMWVSFITCDHSPFYNTDEGIRFVCYILNQYSNHQNKKMSKQLLCNLLNHSDIIPIPKNIDNIIFNILVHNFNLTKKLHLSMLTSKEKQVLLRYTITNYSYRNMNSDYDASIFLISVFKIHSTKLLDILVENTYFIAMHNSNKHNLIDYILNNYTSDNYVLGSFIKYYLSVVLNLVHRSYSTHSPNTPFSKNYFIIIAPILEQALIHKHTDLIRLLLNLKETTKSNILYIIGYDSFYKDKDKLVLAFDYIINVYYKYTFNELSLFDWSYNVNKIKNDTQTEVLFKLFLYKISEEKINNIHNLNKDLLYKIYNYIVYHYNRLNINLIVNKTYSFKGNEDDSSNDASNDASNNASNMSITRVLTYSNSIVDKIESLKLKNDIDTMYKYIIKFYSLIHKCSFLMNLMEKKSSNTDNIGIDKNASKRYNKRLKYMYNIYNYILKNKLYYVSKLKETIKKVSLINLEEINQSKFNIDVNNIDSIITSYKKTSLNRQIISNMLTLKEYLTEVIELVNKD
jgi:hypothetical protein